MQVAFNHAVTGLHAAYADAGQAARDVLEGTRPPPTDPRAAASSAARSDQAVAGVVGLVEAELQLDAAAAVARTADQMTGSLIDILA
ncbi:MAG: hypothetical protein MI723_04735 [Caulobacterales bacterium]|nr:hypothetical protein [Caulobacterales bacterium]